MKLVVFTLAAVARIVCGNVSFPTSSSACTSSYNTIPLPNGHTVCYQDPQDRSCGMRCCDFCWQGKCACIGELPEDDCLAIGRHFDVSVHWHGDGCTCTKSDHMGCCRQSFGVASTSGTTRKLDVCFTETEERNCPEPYDFTCSSYCECDTCTPGSCGNFQPCAQSTLTHPWFRLCYCYTLSDSAEGFCAQNGWCADYRNCNDVSDCPNPKKDECLINTCCGVGKCVPQNFDQTCFNHQNFLLQDTEVDNSECADILVQGISVENAVDRFMEQKGGPMFDTDNVRQQLIEACAGFAMNRRT